MSDPLSVVIATRDRPDLLARCLRTLQEAVREPDEIVVVDSSADAEPVARIGHQHGATVVRSGAGASHQRNLGALAARHRLVAFVDDDVRVSTDWAEGLRSAFVDNPDAAFVTGRIEVPPEQSGYSRPVSIKDDSEPAVLTAATRGTLGHSANMAVRREAFVGIGGFDEELGPGRRLPAAEDSELIDRFFTAGYSGWYEPRALAWHDQWRTRRELVKLEWLYGVGTGARLARLARRDRARARDIAAEDFWGNGIRILPSLVRKRYEFGLMFVFARLTGASVGYVRARRSGFAATRPAPLA